ncbi:hypothetical protein J6590_029029 [Homalodisca vitripennis]|nr:hypothetical protein J6590_029029 [Homalodisca vitripennis]
MLGFEIACLYFPATRRNVLNWPSINSWLGWFHSRFGKLDYLPSLKQAIYAILSYWGYAATSLRGCAAILVWVAA